MSDSLFNYESAFSLILSLQEQIRNVPNNNVDAVEDLTDKFTRLSKLTIGELEFARRMGFESIPCIRISPYPILWTQYDQPVAMDFIINLENMRYCVDVKYYDWKKLGKEFIIKTTKLSSIGKYRDYHFFDGALIALKRFEKWYLFDINDLKKKASSESGLLKINFSELSEINKLTENHISINTGAIKRNTDKFDPPSFATVGGVYVKEIDIDERDCTIRFPFSTTSKAEKDDFCLYEGIQAKVLVSLYTKTLKNLNLIYKEFNYFTNVDKFTDSLPTEFTLSDSVNEIKSSTELKHKCLNTFTNMKVLFSEKGDELRFYYHRLYAILTADERKKDKKKSEIKV